MKYKRGIIVPDKGQFGIPTLERVDEGEKYPYEDIGIVEAYSQAFRTILHELRDGAKLLNCAVISDNEVFETDQKRVKIRLEFEKE